VWLQLQPPLDAFQAVGKVQDATGVFVDHVAQVAGRLR
jgi:hypothetical protein